MSELSGASSAECRLASDKTVRSRKKLGEFQVFVFFCLLCGVWLIPGQDDVEGLEDSFLCTNGGGVIEWGDKCYMSIEDVFNEDNIILIDFQHKMDSYPLHLRKVGLATPCPSICDFEGCVNRFVDCVKPGYNDVFGFYLVATDYIENGSWIVNPYPAGAKLVEKKGRDNCIRVTHNNKKFFFTPDFSFKGLREGGSKICSPMLEKIPRDYYPCLINHSCCKNKNCLCGGPNTKIVSYEIESSDLINYMGCMSFSNVMQMMQPARKKSRKSGMQEEDGLLQVAFQATRDIKAGEILLADYGDSFHIKTCFCPLCAVENRDVFYRITEAFALEPVVRAMYNSHLNMAFQSHYFVSESSILGANDGLFTQERLESGSVVGVYTGNPMKTLESGFRKSYIFEFRECPCFMTQSEWKENLNTDGEGDFVYIDGERHDVSLWGQSQADQGRCLMAFINHNDEPNVECRDDGRVVTLRDIEPGEEIFLQYKRSNMAEDWPDIHSEL